MQNTAPMLFHRPLLSDVLIFQAQSATILVAKVIPEEKSNIILQRIDDPQAALISKMDHAVIEKKTKVSTSRTSMRLYQ